MTRPAKVRAAAAGVAAVLAVAMAATVVGWLLLAVAVESAALLAVFVWLELQ